MTIFYPDVSHFDAGLRLQPGTPIVVAKCTQATSIADSAYQDFKTQAHSIGAVFLGYHWLNHGNIEAQAKWCQDHNGDTPLMIDAEDVAGNTGYSGPLTVSDIVGFTNAYRALGGNVALLYLPHWYWQGNMGSPDLVACNSAELHLVASAYRSYSDSAWPSGYGGMLPVVWQYTDAQQYGAFKVDFNAYKGTVDQFTAMIGGLDMATLNDINNKLDRLWTFFNILINDSDKGNPDGKSGIPINQEIRTILSDVSSFGGLTDADRKAIADLTAAVNALNSRLATP